MPSAPRLPALLALLVLAAAPRLAADPVVERVVTHAQAHPGGDAPASFAPADYAGDLRDLPIGVFDSGVGGLTVLEAIKAFDAHDNRTGRPGADGVPDFADERFLYFGDQANMPYGNYPAAGHQDFLRELALKDAVFLLGRRYWAAAGDPAGPRRDKPPVKAIVIACNTATAYGLADIRAAVAAWKVPVFVVGVVEAGARGLAETRGARTGGVAVLATLATCASNAYPKAITSLSSVPVWQRGSATLAAAIEGDPAVQQAIPDIIRQEVRALLDERRAADTSAPIDTIVLGCTHYPLVQDDILRVFAEFRTQRDATGAQPYAALVAADLLIVDPAAWTAQDLWSELVRRNLRARPGAQRAARDAFFLSVANPKWPGVQLAPDGGLAKAYKYGRTEGDLAREDTVIVPLTPAGLPASSATLVRERLPRTWAALQAGAQN